MVESHLGERQLSADRKFAWLIGPAVLLAFSIGFYWKLLLTGEYTWLNGPDVVYQVTPWLQYQAVQWQRGSFPLWDPYLWGGQPLVGQAQPGAAYPLNWILFLLPLKDGTIRLWFLHWYFVLIHFQAALFTYWLCRDLKRSRGASLVAGIAFGFSGWVGTTDWPQMLNGAVWAPLVVLFLLRVARREREVASAAVAGACLGLAFLSGHHQIPIFLTLAAAGLLAYSVFQDGFDWRRLRAPAVFLICLFMVSALQTLPAYEYGENAVRWVGADNPVGWKDKIPYSIHAKFSFGLGSAVGLVVPGFFDHTNPFMGLAAVVLAAVGLIAAWKEQAVRLVGAIALAGMLLALGESSVFHGVVYALAPMVEKARNPSMAILLFNFGLAVLVGYGIDANEWRRGTAKWLFGWGVLMLTALLVLRLARVPHESGVYLTALAALLLALIIRLELPARLRTLLFAMVLVLEIGNVTGTGFKRRAEPDALWNQLSVHADIVEHIRKTDGPVRVELSNQGIPYNFGDWHGVDQFGGYLASLTENLHRVQASGNARWLLGANYAIAKEPSSPGQELVLASQSGLNLYRNPKAMPRTWIVHEARHVEPEADFDTSMNPLDPARSTFVSGPAPKLASCAGAESSRMVERSANRVVVEARLRCRGMVILGETYFPGWTASIDGRSAEVYEAFTFLRGVVAEAGTHRIEFRYRPWSVVWGAALTLLGLAITGALQFRRE